MLSLTGKLLYFLMGWEFEPLPPYFSSKHVIIGFPHTSNMDAVRAFIGYQIITRTGHIMVKKGFWYIAKAANVSIICWFLDNQNKKARWLGKIIPGENMMDDLIRIRAIYEKAGYLFPLDMAAH